MRKGSCRSVPGHGVGDAMPENAKQDAHHSSSDHISGIEPSEDDNEDIKVE